MRWALQSWARVQFLNRFLAGTWLPRLQMDLIAGLGCAAHFVIVADKPLLTIDDYMAGGRAMQRFWLDATRLGPASQPEMTPLILRPLCQERSLPFTTGRPPSGAGARLAGASRRQLIGPDVDHAVWMGRIGAGVPRRPSARSTRRTARPVLIARAVAGDGLPRGACDRQQPGAQRILFFAEAVTLAHVARPLVLAHGPGPRPLRCAFCPPSPVPVPVQRVSLYRTCHRIDRAAAVHGMRWPRGSPLYDEETFAPTWERTWR